MKGNQFDAATQLRLSPFFDRTSKLNESQEWRRWSGYLSATNYELTHENRNFPGIFFLVPGHLRHSRPLCWIASPIVGISQKIDEGSPCPGEFLGFLNIYKFTFFKFLLR